MDILNIITDLENSIAKETQALQVLRQLAQGNGNKRRGRPPAWMQTSAAQTGTKRRGRPPGSKNKPKQDLDSTTPAEETLLERIAVVEAPPETQENTPIITETPVTETKARRGRKTEAVA